MSRIAPPAEKILAVASIYSALIEELPPVNTEDPRVQVALIDAATRLAMYTDTRDMGLLARRRAGARVREDDPSDHFAYPDDPTGGHHS